MNLSVSQSPQSLSPIPRATLNHSISAASSTTSATTTNNAQRQSTHSNIGNNNNANRHGGGLLQGYALLKQVNEYRSKIQEFVYQVRNGDYTSIVHHDIQITNFLIIGNGSCIVGIQTIATALASNIEAMDAAGPHRQIRFVSICVRDSRQR